MQWSATNELRQQRDVIETRNANEAATNSDKKMDHVLKLRLWHVENQIWRDEDTLKLGQVFDQPNGDISFEFVNDNGNLDVIRRRRRDVIFRVGELPSDVLDYK